MASTAAASLSTLAIGAAPIKPAGSRRPIAVSSANGLRTVERAIELVKQGHDPLDAAIEGVAIVEADPKDHSVGLGGLPNEDGVVELDAAVMHGPTHGGGSVASIRNIVHPAAVARLVMQRSAALPARRRGGAAVRPGPRLPRGQSADRRGAADLAALEGDPRPQRRLAPAPARREGRRVHPRGAHAEGHRHDPLLGPRHPRRPRLHHHDLGPVVEDPRPRRRFAHPRRGAVPR